MLAEQQAMAMLEVEPESQPRRRLSWVRILGVAVVVGALLAGAAALRTRAAAPAAARSASSFAPYVDVTATPQFGFEDPAQSSATSVVLGFVVATPSAACQPSWGGAYSLATAGTGLDLDRRIARVRQRGGDVAVSFGGAANSELSSGCTDPARLAAAYRAVVDRYSLKTIDLDIEDASAPAAVAQRRAAAIATVQRAEQAAGRRLDVWLTLPVDPAGLTGAGTTALDAMLAARVGLAGVNALTMDYGQAPGQSMASLSESALTALADQLGTAYARAGTPLTVAQRWRHVGATPMIGQNDTAGERFGLTDARELVAFGQRHGMRRMSMWSANRDQACGPNYADTEVVSDSCSGVKQNAGAFTTALGAFGTAAPSPTAIGTGAPAVTDDPSTSPYPIWNPLQSYPKNSKVVWHRNVYKAKWWTQGDTPDAPVAQEAETPWTLVGPVLPDETPAAVPTISAGTYQEWSPSHTYVAGDRVEYQGVGYQAKWWTTGDEPGAAVTDPSDTPWQRLDA